jgi:hypothetical protein
VAGCPSCAAELELAAKIQRELRRLPLLDCPPEVVERARDSSGGAVVPFRPRQRALALRLAVAAALLLAVGGAVLFLRVQRPQPSRREIAQATAEARIALAYLGKVTRRTSLNLRDDVLQKRLVEPAGRSVSRSLGEMSSLTAEPDPAGGRSGKEL